MFPQAAQILSKKKAIAASDTHHDQVLLGLAMPNRGRRLVAGRGRLGVAREARSAVSASE